MSKTKCLVLVGPECTGKTTQARMITENYSSKLVKNIRVKDRFQMLANVINDIQQMVIRTSWGTSESPVVFDRWQLIDDIIYEKYCYGSESIMEPLLPVLGKACKDAGILFVYLTIAEDEMVSRFAERGDLLRTIEEAVITRKAYQEFFRTNRAILPHIKIDVTGMTPEELYKTIVELSGI
jgi:deoxyadenosine/deoxycytidine kinase